MFETEEKQSVKTQKMRILPILILVLMASTTIIATTAPASAKDASTIKTPIVKNSHIIIIPNEIVIEVLSFYIPPASSANTRGAMIAIEIPQSSELLNISGSLIYSTVKRNSNLILLENATITNESHIALEYSIPDHIFSKKITMETDRLLILLPASIEITNKSDNLMFVGKASLGQGNYSIFEARNLLPGDEIRLEFEERQSAVTNQELNPVFIGGIVLIIGGSVLLALSTRRKWDLEDRKGEEEDTKEKRWEI